MTSSARCRGRIYKGYHVEIDRVFGDFERFAHESDAFGNTAGLKECT
jgi:hypothetical protein